MGSLAIIGNCVGAGGGVGSGIKFNAPLTSTLTPKIGTLSAFTTEVSDNQMTVTDFEGLVKDTVGDEARFVGARRVENILDDSEILDNQDVWVQQNCTVNDNQISYIGSYTHRQLKQTTTKVLPVGSKIRVSVRAKLVSNTQAMADNDFLLRVTTSLSPEDTLIGQQLTNEFQTFTSDVLTTTSATGTDVWFRSVNTGNDVVVEVDWVQLEDVTGQANQNPSEYVSVGVGTEAALPAFSTPFTNSHATATESGNTITVTDPGGTVLTYTQNQGLRVGALYAVTITVNISAGGLRPRVGGNYGPVWITSAENNIPQTLVLEADTDLFGVQYLDNTVGTTTYTIKEIDHGSNVDGVKYFDYENGNTVSSNVVTEATGSAIADATLKGVLVEEGSENFVHQSQDLTTWWTQTNAQIDTADVIQNGSETLLRLEDGNTNNAQHRISYNITPNNTGPVTISCTVVDGDKSHVAIKENGDGTGERDSYFNPTTGVWDTVHANHTEGVEEIRAGVYRIWITTTWTTGAARIVCVNLAESAPGGLVYVGTVGEGMHVGAIQVEELPYPTSYIPTEGSTVTRSNTTLQYDNTSGAIDNTVGSVLVEVSGVTFRAGANSNVISFNNNDARNLLYMQATAVVTSRSQAGDVSYPATVIPLLSDIKIGAYYSATDNVLGTVVDGTADLTPAASFDSYVHTDQKITLNASAYQNGSIKNLKFYNKNLGVDKMKELTS